MSAISLKSITGITSITTPAGVDNQLTLHTNDTTQRVKVSQSGMEVVGIATFQDIDVDGHTELDNVRISGIASVHNTLQYTTTGGAHIDHGTTNQNLNFRVSKSSTADTTMMQINAASEQTKFRKIITVGFQGGDDIAQIGGGAGIGAYLQLNHANNNIVNTKLMGNNTSWLNSHYGNLGIGTQTPQAKFVVSNAGANGLEFNPNFNSNNSIIASYNRTGGGSYSQLTLSSSQHIFAQGGTEYARIDSGGRLLIGIDTVHPIGDNPQFLLAGTNYRRSLFGMQRFQNDQFGPTIILAHSRNANDAGHTILQDGDELGKIRFNGSDGVDFVSGGAEISVNVDGTPSADDMPSSMRFKTTSSGQGPNERLRIQASGKISIGSSETSTGLLLLDKNITAESDVSDKNNYHLVIRSQSDSNTSKIGIAFANTTHDTHVGAAILHHRETTDSVGSLAFYTSPSSGTTTEKLRITRYGEFGLSGANYGTAGQVLTSGGSGQPVEWRTIVQAPVISSISGSIVANLSGTTLTLTGQGFIASAQGVVNFSGGSLNPSKNVNATPSSSTTLTVTVPSDVANNVNSGETITIKFTTSAGLISSGINTTVIAAPSGGSITTSGNYRIHTFTSSSNFVLTKSIACEYLVIAGGGGGGGNDGGQDFSGGSGGGGAGGYRTGTITPSANTHTVTVGGGGSGNNSAAAGGDGGNSAFGSIVSGGGGGGGGVNNAGSNGRNGGSGGGAGGDDGSTLFTGGSGTSGQGNNGGNAGGSNSNAGGGGGGGAGAVGETAANGFAGGDGGAGAVNSINGSSAVWAGGGGGSVGAGADKGLGGSGGGGNGAARNVSNAVAGVTNTGGGGGAGADSNVTAQKAGANGGSGIVIVRYDITNL